MSRFRRAIGPIEWGGFKALKPTIVGFNLKNFADATASRLTFYVDYEIDGLGNLRFNVRDGGLRVAPHNQVGESP